VRPQHVVAQATAWVLQVAKIQREHDAREVELRKAVEHFESVKKSAGPSAECDPTSQYMYRMCVCAYGGVCPQSTGLRIRFYTVMVMEQSDRGGADAVAAGRSVVKAREAADAIDRDLKAIAARAREAEARRAELEKAFKMQVRSRPLPVV